MEELLDWEHQSDLPYRKHLIAGSIAGATEHLIMFPMDTIRVTPSKTNLQAHGARFSGIWEAASGLYRDAGVWRMWKGWGTAVLGCIPAHALYFTIYEVGKSCFDVESDRRLYLFSTLAIGAAAHFSHDAIMTPVDGYVYVVIKQRLQLDGRTQPLAMAASILKEEGMAGLYRSFPITLVLATQMMNVPFAGLFITFNENLKSLFFPHTNISISDYFICAGLSAGLAAALTTPLDVIKTRIQTQEGAESPGRKRKGVRYASIKDTVAALRSEKGSFWKGVVPRTMFFLPSAAFSWATYEYVKQCLR